MPNHTLRESTTAPAALQSPPAWQHVGLGDAVVLLFAPLVVVGYYAAITVLKFLQREDSLNSPAAS